MVDIPDYNNEEIEKMDLIDLIDFIWERADKSKVDNRDYKEILTEALSKKYGENQ